MRTNPTISVIMATFNAQGFIEFAIQSVLAQTYTDFELIIIGDCCTDGTAQVVSRFADSRIRWHNLRTNSGSQGIPNKEGLSRATGNYIAYLSHDDLWFPQHLQTALDYLNAHNLDWIHSAGFILKPNGQLDFFGAIKPIADYQSFGIGPSAWFHRRGVAEAAGNWRNHLQCLTYVDQDLQIRIAKRGFRMGSSHEPSLIKFCAPAWRMLSKTKRTYPQADSYQHLAANADAYLHALLRQTATQYGQAETRQLMGETSWRDLAKIAWRPLRRWTRRWFINMALDGNKLVHKLLIWQNRGMRRRRAKMTGEAEHHQKAANQS